MPDERCDLCGFPMHRYGFPSDGRHAPNPVACANNVLAEIDKGLDAVGWLERVQTAVTRMGIELQRMRAEHVLDPPAEKERSTQ